MACAVSLVDLVLAGISCNRVLTASKGLVIAVAIPAAAPPETKFIDGLRSLFGGLGIRMARKAISSALAWTVYEELILRAIIQKVECV
jgi:hypothetical protein